MRTKLTLLLCLLFTDISFAQSGNGNKQVEKLCGCFSVNFRYAETFSPDEAYKYHDREDMNATELVLPLEQSDTRIVMQHLLVISDTMIIKHWREEWVYESPVIYQYKGDRVWTKRELPAAEVKNKWMQTVWEVSDEPRYQGLSSWIENDGKTFWESTADAPLPRREYTVRNDYNILKRRNRIMLTEDGYIHEQDNDKILRTDKGDRVIAQEKGYNSYYRMDESECQAAKDWWKKNEAFWTVVRKEWQVILSGTPVVTLKPKVDDKVLNEHLTMLWKDWSNHKIASPDLPGKVKDVLAKFL